MTWSASLSSIVSNSIFPWVDCTTALKSLTRGTTTSSWVRSVRRSAFATTVSKLAIDRRTETPEVWLMT